MNNSIPKLDYSRYYDLVNLLLPDPVSLYIFDVEGSIVWRHENNNTPIKQININHNIKQRNNNKVYVHTHGNQVIYIKYLYNCADELYGGVVVCIKSLEKDNKIAESILHISNIISNEISMTSELEALTDELEERYEELNLVFESDEIQLDDDIGLEVFDKLVANCAEYLDVAMSVLIMPREDLTVINSRNSEKIHYLHSMLTQFKNYTFPWIVKNQQTIVSNDLTDQYRLEAFPDIPYKLICSPIYITDHIIGGVLITLNPNSAKDFTNSDRNLIEAMSKRASKSAMSHYDGLTGLFKRSVYENYLEKALIVCKSEAKSFCLLHIDIDNITVINESISNKAGDYLINDIANLLRDNTREVDIISRLAGDKFGILLDSCSLEAGCEIADNLRNVIDKAKHNYEGQSFESTVCIGVSEINADTENILSAIAAADLAVNLAKENGRNIVQAYHQGDTVLQRRKEEVIWVREIQKALKQDQFVLHCQPIMPIQNGSDVYHFEILVRMLDDKGNIVPPYQFIPTAEKFKLITQIDRWVVLNTFQILNEYISIANNYVWTINLSGLSFSDIDIANEIIEMAERFQVSPNHICFEITETAALNDVQNTNQVISKLKQAGFSFALDDFGTGSSTFEYLKNLNVDYLKIDGAFITNIVSDDFADAVVKSISSVSKVKNIQTIAEFVENKEITEHLKNIGIDYVQGYGIGKPLLLKECLTNLSLHNQYIVNH